MKKYYNKYNYFIIMNCMKINIYFGFLKKKKESKHEDKFFYSLLVHDLSDNICQIV